MGITFKINQVFLFFFNTKIDVCLIDLWDKVWNMYSSAHSCLVYKMEQNALFNDVMHLRVYYTPYWKYACFFMLSKIINTFKK